MSDRHRDAHQRDEAMHEVKGYPSASVNEHYHKSLDGTSAWVRDGRLPNVLDIEQGYNVPVSEVDGDVYAIFSPNMPVNGIVWQSGTTVRVTFDSGYTSTLYAVNSFLRISGEVTKVIHNGTWVITTVNASYLEITNAGVTDGTEDVASGSAADGYVIHENFDPENLANGGAIPHHGYVQYNSAADVWFGDAARIGDLFYNDNSSSYWTYDGSDFVPFRGTGEKEIEIGDWNMDTTATKDVAHGLSFSEWQSIRDVRIIVRNDDDLIKYTAPYTSSALYMTALDTANAKLSRASTGFFDSTSFDSTSYNRGWVTITYTPD